MGAASASDKFCTENRGLDLEIETSLCRFPAIWCRRAIGTAGSMGIFTSGVQT